MDSDCSLGVQIAKEPEEASKPNCQVLIWEQTPMRTVSLFSGCGGSDLGAKEAGADVIFAMDISPNAVKTYENHRDLLASPDVLVKLGDVGKLDNLPTCDLLLGCYPCQGYSMGGTRSPDADRKTSLYLAFARCLR